MIRIGVVGLRFGAQVHVPAFRANDGCTIGALADQDVDRTRSICSELGVPAAYADWHELLDDESIDAVSIAVPPSQQAAIVMEAARRGKHVFCEKPLASTLADAERALECVRGAGVVHAIDFIFPELPAWQLTRKLLRDGVIGAPRHFAYTWRLETYTSRTRADSWKNRNGEGGGVVGNLLPHVVFNLQWLFGGIVGIDNVPRRAAPIAASFCDGVAYLADGLHGSISVSTDAYLGGGHHLEIFGEAGTIVLHNPTSDHAQGFEVSVGTRSSGRLDVVSDDSPRTEIDGRIAPVGRIVRRFLDAIRDRGRVTPNLEDGVQVQRWLQRITDAHTN